MSMDDGRELDAIHEHNRRSWEEWAEAVFGVPLDELIAAMTADELRAALAILEGAAERQRRQAERN